MPTPDRTTIRVAVDALVAALRTGLVADPPTGARPFRSVLAQPGEPTSRPRPFLTVSLAKAEPVGVSDGDKLFAVTGVIRVVGDAAGDDAHAAMLDAVGAVEDVLDGMLGAGVVEGASGFDHRVWTFAYPTTTAGVGLVIAEADHSFVARVERSFHRVPAP